MPLTNAEKQKQYRDRLKEAGKYSLVKEKDRLRHQNQRSGMNRVQKAKLRMRNRTYKQKERQKTKDRKVAETHATPSINTSLLSSPETSATPTSSPSIFSNRQVHGKMKKKLLLALPKSPRKRIALIEEIAQKEGVMKVNCQMLSNTTRVTTNSPEVEDFYNSDIISWQAPGLKDFIIIRKDGQKERIQKRYLLTTLKEAHALYLENNVDQPISFSKFAALRPPHVQLQKDIPHSVCVCKTHENVRLLLKALREKGLQIHITFREFISSVVCVQDNEECMLGTCNNCPKLTHLLISDEEIMEEECTYNQWFSDGGLVRKDEVAGTIQDAFDNLKSQLPPFLHHTFVKRVQQNYFIKCQKNPGEGEGILQVDFAENFTCKEQDEIQAAHWVNKQVTIFTAVCWFRSHGEVNCQSYALV